MAKHVFTGDTVLYVLNHYDADAINKRRKDFDTYRQTDSYVDTGYLAHSGNDARAGQIFPATVVRVWGDRAGSAINLQVHLDGTDTFWATSRLEGGGEGQWFHRPSH